MPTPAVSVRKLTVQFNDNVVLNDISFDIEKGSIAAIIGPNGSGKTTLFKAILDLVPSTGSVKILNKSLKQSLKKISYVPQHFDFDRSLPITVKEFLSFSDPPSEKGQKTICEEIHIKHLLPRIIGELSGGQLQRVLFANALMHNPELLLLDEAAAGIDIKGERTFYELIQHVNKKHHVTIMMISHEINMVYQFADQIICLNKDLVCNGVPKQALTEEVMEQLYGKDMRMRPHKHL